MAVTKRDIQWNNANEVVLKTHILEPVKDPETGKEIKDSFVEKIVTEAWSIDKLRDVMRTNKKIHEELLEDLKSAERNPLTKPEPLPNRLQVLLADIEKINDWRKENNAYELAVRKIKDTQENIRRATEALKVNYDALALRRQEYPDSSVDAIDDYQP